MNMKHILGIFALTMTLTVFGQKEYDDLRILYADGKYEKLVKVADGYTNNDKTKKDALPYFWLARGLYKIHQKGSADPVYKSAYKDAINAVSKGIKFDKSGSVLSQSEYVEFLDEIQGSIVEQITNEITANNYRKAFGWVNSYKKISANPIGQMFLDGVCKFRTDDKSSAFTLWKQVDTQLKSINSIDAWSKGDIDMLRLGAVQTAECYVSSKKVEDAKAILNKVSKWFAEDETFQEAYKAIAK